MKYGMLWGVLGCVLCVLLCHVYSESHTAQRGRTVQMEIQFESQTQDSDAEQYDERTMIRVISEDGTEEMPLNAYLTGVLLAEVPSSFAEDARKAQAVAARTFTLKQMENQKHNGGICTDSGCCQAFADWKEMPPEAVKIMRDAVAQTDGEVVEYEGKLIDAVFFSCSGGRTEAAVAVWGGDVPYLQAVDSPGEEDAAPFFDKKEIPLEEFRQLILQLEPEANLQGPPEGWIGKTIYTIGDGVDTIAIGGKPIRGTALRSAFSLRSTMFRIQIEESYVTFYTMGFGHRVGMSQFGANAMAENGSNYRQILTYYYQGTDITRLEP